MTEPYVVLHPQLLLRRGPRPQLLVLLRQRGRVGLLHVALPERVRVGNHRGLEAAAAAAALRQCLLAGLRQERQQLRLERVDLGLVLRQLLSSQFLVGAY